MEILKDMEQKVFNIAVLSRGYFIYGKHRSWPEGVNGLIANVAEEELLVQFLPGIRNVTNHYRIRAEDTANGEWELKISRDLKSIEEVGSIGTS